jgi:hypothetical protein
MPTAETIQKAWMKTIAYAPNPGKISTWMSRNKVENISSQSKTIMEQNYCEPKAKF